MSHDIIDNHSKKLEQEINTLLMNSRLARFASGYFFLSGFNAIQPSLNNLEEMRLLVGSVNDQPTIEEIASGQRRLKDMDSELDLQKFPKKVEQQLWVKDSTEAVAGVASAMRQDDDCQENIRKLSNLVAQSKVKVKLYTKGKLHAKAYIFDYCPRFDVNGNPLPLPDPGCGIIGSSNFSLAGLTHNSELNVKIHGADNHKELGAWFDRLWSESIDFQNLFQQELRASWAIAEPTPYEVYLKALYEFVKDRLDDSDSREFMWQSEIFANLTDFQRNAVKRAVKIIRLYGGCFVSDVVGLGKSYIGAAILKQFEREERVRSLIICPASLKTMWEMYNERYQLNAQVLPMSRLKVDKNGRTNYLLDDPMLRDRDFVLVDESHNFRNSNIQRYKMLQEFLQNGNRQCVFLTATPRNKSLKDLYNQIKLYHVADATMIPIDPPNLKDFCDKVEDGERKAASLLSNIMVRRTRMDVLRWYGLDSETNQAVDPFIFEPYRTGEKRAYILVNERKQFFPKRQLKTINYNIDETYSGLYDELLDLLGRPNVDPETVDSLKYARYGLWNYVHKNLQNKSPYNELQRAGINLRGLMRVSLFKRLESSVEAFRQTVKRVSENHRKFLEAMDTGIIPAGEEANDIMTGVRSVEDDVYAEELAQASGKYEASAFRLDDLRQDIQHDLKILQRMHAMISVIHEEEDDKLQELKTWLLAGKEGSEPLANKKCLIFTQYEDTAKYLHKYLKKSIPEHFEFISGSGKDKMLTAFRFSPKANEHYKPKGYTEEIQVLLATDVMSEGLNLQDCSRIINYDLHWNPVRLIQRFGRIDRIGTEHDVIYAYNFLPEQGIDQGLGLMDKLRQRINAMNAMLGGDSRILEESEQFNAEAFEVIYGGKQIDKYDGLDDEDLVDLTEAEEFLRKIKQNEPELFKRIIDLRDGVRSAKSGQPRQTFVVCRAGHYRQLYSVDVNGAIIARDVSQGLGAMQCLPETPREALPARYNETITDVQDRFEEDVKLWSGKQRSSPALTLAQRYVVSELYKQYQDTEDADQRSQLELFIQVFSEPLTRAVESELRVARKNKMEGANLLAYLDNAYIKYGLGERKKKVKIGQEGDRVPVVVCSLGVV